MSTTSPSATSPLAKASVVRKMIQTGKIWPSSVKARNAGSADTATAFELMSNLPQRRTLEQALRTQRQHAGHYEVDDEKLCRRHEMNGRRACQPDQERRDGRALDAAQAPDHYDREA